MPARDSDLRKVRVVGSTKKQGERVCKEEALRFPSPIST